MMSRTYVILALVLAGQIFISRPALAHDGEPHGSGLWWTNWSFEPGVILLLTITLLFYLRGVWAMTRRSGVTSRRFRLRSAAFLAGLLTLAVALVSPVDALAGQLFWVHMLQHNLLMLVAAPLLVLGYPLPPLLLGLPEGIRRQLGQGWNRAVGLRRAWGILSSPLSAWLLNAFFLWVWHAPGLYQASVAVEWVHILQHFSFLGSALLFWWVTLYTFSVRPALRGAGILYLFTTALHSGILGALLTFSTRVWYPIYAGRAENWGMSVLADQQLAGIIMWVPGGVIYLVASLWMMKIWLDSMEARDEALLRKESEKENALEP